MAGEATSRSMGSNMRLVVEESWIISPLIRQSFAWVNGILIKDNLTCIIYTALTYRLSVISTMYVFKVLYKLYNNKKYMYQLSSYV